MSDSPPVRNPLHDATDGRHARFDVIRESLIAWREAWPVLILGGACAVVFVLSLVGEIRSGGEDPMIAWGGFSAAALAEGRWWTPLTSMFLHGGFSHLFMNMSALLALGASVFWWLGSDWKGGVRFFQLYFLSGLIGAVLFLAFNPTDHTPMVGASGAIFGLFGAVSRFAGGGTLAPIISRHVWRSARMAILINVVIVGVFALAKHFLGRFEGGLAWEAHLGGYITGLILIGLPAFRTRQPPEAFDDEASGEEAVAEG